MGRKSNPKAPAEIFVELEVTQGMRASISVQRSGASLLLLRRLHGNPSRKKDTFFRALVLMQVIFLHSEGIGLPEIRVWGLGAPQHLTLEKATNLNPNPEP